MARIYFASPMEGIESRIIKNRYDQIEQYLKKHGHDLINPFPFYAKEFNSPIKDKPNATTIVNRDLDCLKSSEILLLDFSDENHVYIGCIFEIAYAKVYNKRVIIITHNPKYYLHPWIIFHSDLICKTIEEAIRFIYSSLF